MGASIREIAERVGVTASSVSIYLNSPDTHRVGKATKRRIDAAVRDLNYRKNLFASSLSRERSMIIGIIIPTLEPHFQNLFTNTLLSGVQHRLAESSYSMLFFPSSANSSMEIVREQLDRSAGCDGYVLFSTGFCPMRDIQQNIRELTETGKPFVTLNVPEVEEKVNQVLIEDLVTARGVEYLMQAGHREVLLVLGRRNGEHVRLMLDDYRSVLNRHGRVFDNGLVVYGNYDADVARNAVLRVLSSGQSVTAVCCMSDTMAAGAASAVRSLGLRIPEDISLVGRNNGVISKYLSPPLTTIDLHIRAAGEHAAELLLGNITEKTEPRQIRVAGTIVERESVNGVSHAD